MSACLTEDVLQAYLDRELAESDSSSIVGHIGECHDCRARLESMQASIHHVDSLMDSLVPGGAPETATIPSSIPLEFPQRTAAFGWASAISLAVIAATLVLALQFFKQPPVQPPNNIAKPASPVPPHLVFTSIAPIEREPLRIRTLPAAAHMHSTRPEERDFIPLDDGGPIEWGYIYQVKVPASLFAGVITPSLAGDIPVEIIVDGTGRARAIRFLAVRFSIGKETR
jgi:hypothetical protein